ncbi:Hypothetical protein ABZS17D1_03723 [Kosakonia cowanii]
MATPLSMDSPRWRCMGGESHSGNIIAINRETAHIIQE